jgi:hypothetical protein
LTASGSVRLRYEAMREQTLARQKEMGLVPPDTELPPINPIGTPETRTGPDGEPFPALDYTRPWDSLSAEEQRLFSRMAEVYACFLAHTDDQIGTTPVAVVPWPGAADLDAASDRVDAVLDAGQTRAPTPWLGARSRARSRAHRTPARLPVATDRLEAPGPACLPAFWTGSRQQT